MSVSIGYRAVRRGNDYQHEPMTKEMMRLGNLGQIQDAELLRVIIGFADERDQTDAGLPRAYR